MLAKSLISPKSLLTVGGIFCVVAFIWAINVEDRDTPGTLFTIGWFIAVSGIVLNMLLMDSSSPMAKPLKIFAVGFSIIALGGLYEMLTEKPSEVFFNIGFIICFLGIAWGILGFGRHK